MVRVSSFTGTLFLTALSFLPSILAAPTPIVVYPGTVQDVVVTKDDTLNSTAAHRVMDDATSSNSLKLSFVNYLSSTNIKGYVTGLDPSGKLVFLGPNGQYYYPSTTASTPQSIPSSAITLPVGGQNSQNNYVIPAYLNSARLYFSDGDLQFFVVSTPNGAGLVEPSAVNPNDPNAATNWGFAEVNWNGGVYGDISFVDFVGLPLGMQLTVTDGSGTQQALGLQSDAVSKVCSALQAQQQVDGAPWGEECAYTSSGALVRVLAPIDTLSNNNGYWSNYWNSYIQQVFQYYSTNPLTINTQAAAGDVTCTASTSSMTITCAGDNRAYSAPSAADIFGCNSGPFGFESGDNSVHYAVVPRLCAAFNRGDLLTSGGNVQPSQAPSAYYPSGVVGNYYSKFVHEYEWQGKGYAFSYDDVAASNDENVSGSVVSSNPDTLTVFIGGYDLA